MLKIRDFATLAQVSVRLLHYYDQIGLLRPLRTDTSNGYRYYSIDQLPRLNRILALRDLGLALDDIALMLNDDVRPAQIRDILTRRQQELRARIAQDQARVAQAEMRLRSIESEGTLPPYDIVLKHIPAESAITSEITFKEGQTIVDFYACGGSALREAGLRGRVAATVGIYPHAFVFERTPRSPFIFQPAYIVAHADAVALDVPGYGRLEPGRLPGYVLVASTLHEAPYNRLFGAHLALHHWAEAHAYRPVGIIREVYLRDAAAGVPPLVEVQMPLRETQMSQPS